MAYQLSSVVEYSPFFIVLIAAAGAILGFIISDHRHKFLNACLIFISVALLLDLIAITIEIWVIWTIFSKYNSPINFYVILERVYYFIVYPPLIIALVQYRRSRPQRRSQDEYL